MEEPTGLTGSELYGQSPPDHAKRWDLMISWRQYTLTASLGPENILKENKSIPFFVFEYFSQKDISGLIDESLEKTCLFHFEEVDGIGLISTQIKNASRFLDDEQASFLIERFAKRKKERLQLLKASTSFRVFSILQRRVYLLLCKIFRF